MGEVERMSAKGIKVGRFQNTGIFDKYLYASVLQKSIRRGYVDTALQVAALFLQHQPDYIWRRINIIALEDVGVANIELVNSCLWLSGKKDWRRKNGGDEEILFDLIRELCRSPKDRNFCDAVEAADHHPEFKAVREQYCEQSDDFLVEVISNPDTGLYHRILATWVLMGTSRYPAKKLVSYRNQVTRVVQSYQSMNLPQPVMDAFMMAKGKSSDNMAVGIIPVWMHVVGKRSVQLISHDLDMPLIAQEEMLSDEIVNGIPLAALDKHTWQGKKAIERFCHGCAPLNEFLRQHVRQEEWVRYVGWVLFCIEGDNVNLRLRYEGYDDAKWRMLEGQLLTIRFRQKNLNMLKFVVKANLFQINLNRLVCVSS